MALVEAESLILRTYNLGDAEKIVVLFTRDQGIIRGVAKGAKRLKSNFGSSLEPFSQGRVTYLQKENVELVSIEKIEVILSMFVVASRPEFLQKFSYLSTLLIACLPPHDPNETLYRMTQACIEQAIAEPDRLAGVGLYFELWLLRLTGYLPDWSRCQECRRVFDDEEESELQPGFQLLCSRCRPMRSMRPIDCR